LTEQVRCGMTPTYDTHRTRLSDSRQQFAHFYAEFRSEIVTAMMEGNEVFTIAINST
jgi:predicted SnoaL-like aldol condensation-catalyzing enzyme